MVECQVNDGLMILCQMVVGEKLAFDPVAQRLFDNTLDYAADYCRFAASKRPSSWPRTARRWLLRESGLKFDLAGDVLGGHRRTARYQIVVFDATPAASCNRLAGNLR